MPPAIPVPALPPTLEEAVVVVTELDPETIDVSVRVLSPGENAAPSPQNGVIPPIAGGDTTIEADLDAAGSDEEAPSAESPAVNTNVSVRVLSPGSNGSTSDDDGGGGTVATAGAAPASSEPDAAPAATATSEDTADSSQYQDPNSQYQSDRDIAKDPWNWSWTLTVDCAGNPTSSSIDSGDPESLDWSWSWAWEWGCATGEAPKPEGASTRATQEPAPKAEPRPPPPSEAQSASGAAASEGETEPWSWTWTFTFCGQETTVTTLGGAGTPLTWAWDWSWVWSCGSTEPAGDTGLPTGPPPAGPAVPTVPLPAPSSVVTASSSSQDAAPGPETRSLQAVSPPFVTFSFDTGIGAATFELPSAPSIPAEITVSVAIPSAVSPLSAAVPPVPLQVRPFPLGAAPLELGPHAAPMPGPRAEPSTTTSAPPSLPVARPGGTSAGALHEGRPRPETKRHAEVKRARPDFRPALPLFPRSRHGAASTSASGAASSALLVGFVALTGFILLAAPAPGRRLEAARELSPRGLDRSPLDHPG